jgi:hypothetical protein
MADGLSDDKIYSELCSHIRATDDISFKLMGSVPLVSGAGLLTLLLRAPAPSTPILIVLSLFGALVTLGLFRWELRNIQRCTWLIHYAQGLERKALEGGDIGRAFVPQPNSPQGIGKGQAEKFIYFFTVITWLVVPVSLPTRAQIEASSCSLYFLVAGAIAVATVISLFAKVD